MRRFPAALGAAALLALLSAGSARGMDWSLLSPRPGPDAAEPGQRGLDEIDDLPAREAACPACSHPVLVPEADKLMRRPAGQAGAAPEWRMHAGSRDADLCPHPGRNKVAFQADVVICPACGFAAGAEEFGRPIPAEIAAWAAAALRPNLREAQNRLLGARAGEMTERQIVDFFNRQEDIPDAIRLEHLRIYRVAARLPRLRQAEAAWLAAWAARREVAAPPRNDFLARRAANVLAAMGKNPSGPAGELEALDRLLGRGRGSRDRLNPAERVAARMLAAGLKDRLGLGREAEAELGDLLAWLKERFLRPDQDPLWSATTPRASRAYRLDELENIRREAEGEAAVRLDLLREEAGNLNRAAQLIREALLAGECDGDPDGALFHSYLAAEFLRRTGDLPLAAEWFRNLAALAPGDSPLGRAARERLDRLNGQAGDRVNLLSALGRDGEVFEKLRKICGAGKAPEKREG